jgi:hypothetical protein
MTHPRLPLADQPLERATTKARTAAGLSFVVRRAGCVADRLEASPKRAFGESARGYSLMTAHQLASRRCVATTCTGDALGRAPAFVAEVPVAAVAHPWATA